MTSLDRIANALDDLRTETAVAARMLEGRNRRLAMINAILGDGHEKIEGAHLELLRKIVDTPSVDELSLEFVTAADGSGEADLAKIERALKPKGRFSRAKASFTPIVEG